MPSLHDLHLYIWKMLTNREMVNFQKWDFFDFLYTFTINCVTAWARNMPIECIFCFICSKQSIKIISSRKKCGLFSSVFKKIIPNNTTLTFQEEGGVTYPLIFCRWHNHNIDWFLLSRYFYFFVCYHFQLKWTGASTHI